MALAKTRPWSFLNIGHEAKRALASTNGGPCASQDPIRRVEIELATAYTVVRRRLTIAASEVRTVHTRHFLSPLHLA